MTPIATRPAPTPSPQRTRPVSDMGFLYVILCSILALGSLNSTADSATVYFNGDILTMSGETPNYVQSIVVKGDRITFTGDKPGALAAAGPKPILRDLKGHTLLPGFIDTWGHFTLVAQNTLGVNLGYFSENPPSTKAQLIGKLRKEGKPFNGWIIGTGYADAVLSDGPLSLSDLDEAFPKPTRSRRKHLDAHRAGQFCRVEEIGYYRIHKSGLGIHCP